MPDKTARPFLPLIPGPLNKLRQRVRGGGPPPRESAADHGQALLRQVEAFQRVVNEQAASRPADLPPLPDDLQVIVEAKRLLPEQTRSLGLTPIEEREDGILVTVSPDVTLPLLVSKAESYISERTDSGNPKYGGVIAPIENIRPARREDKAGERLTSWLDSDEFDPDELLPVDVELAGGDSELGEQNRQQFYAYLSRFRARESPYAETIVTATGNFLIEADYSLHRVQLPGRAILDLLDDSRANWILSIDLTPTLEPRLPLLTTGAGGALPPIPALSPDAPRIVIVDSGIAAGHPLFTGDQGQTLIGRQLNFLPDSAEPPDLLTDEIDQGHGTAVASIAAYGSLMPLILGRDGLARPVCWLENAKILLPAARLDPAQPAAQPALHPDQLPKALIREVVAAFHETMPRQCKIFVLTAGSGLHPRHTVANWAEELDRLAAQHDLLFVVTTGNLPPGDIPSLVAAEYDYPDFLLHPQARLLNPGQARTALTVGALAPEPAGQLAPWSHEQLLAPVEHPAPFTRSGSQPAGGPVKPEVVEWGGNLHRGDLTPAPELAMPVANRDFVTGAADQPFVFQYGTELAAARVAHLAGQIQAQYPQASANLIRALIVNSAGWPRPFVESLTTNGIETLTKEDKQKLLRLCGYGLPQADKALSANAECMVFVTEDRFSWTEQDKNSSGRYPSKVSFYSIRFEPDDLFGLPAGTRVRVSVTLAYNPAVRKTQRRRYQAVDMRWQLKRREESSEDFYARWMAEAEGNEDLEPEEAGPPKPWPWLLKPVLNPGGRVRKGSLIRDWFELYAHELPHTLELVVLAMVAPWRKPTEPLTQPFALVVSVEAVGEAVPIYDAVRVREDGKMRENYE